MNHQRGAMMLPLPSLDDLESSQLLQLARRGDQDAFAVLYDRYVYSGRRLARHLGMREEANDVVAEAFARILDLVARGKGPSTSFRAYLFTAIRHEAGHRAKARSKVLTTDDESQIDQPVPFGGTGLDDFERTTVLAAYESLPERWQTVLWQLDVEGHRPQDVAAVLELSPNSVSALVYRARAGLRLAYLQQHLAPATDDTAEPCRDIRSRLPRLVQGLGAERERARTFVHLETCSDCAAVHAELQATGIEVGIGAVHRRPS